MRGGVRPSAKHACPTPQKASAAAHAAPLGEGPTDSRPAHQHHARHTDRARHIRHKQGHTNVKALMLAYFRHYGAKAGVDFYGAVRVSVRPVVVVRPPVRSF